MEKGMFDNSANPNPLPSAFPPAANAAFFNGLDASASKQLSLLTATAQARAAHAQAAATGTSSATSYVALGGPEQSFPSAHQLPAAAFASPYNTMQQQQQQQQNMTQPHMAQANMGVPSARQLTPHQQQLVQQQHQQNQQQHNILVQKQRRLIFLQNLARVLVQRNQPLPAFITGHEPPPNPNAVYPSPWGDLEPASEPGGIKFAGRDVDLYKMWTLVNSAGGANKLQQQGTWANLLPHLGLPEHLPQAQENGNTSTAMAFAQLYMKLLNPLDETYHKQMNEQQQQRNLAQQGRLPPAQQAGASFPGGGHNTPPASSANQSQSQPQTPSQPLMHPPQAMSQVQQSSVVEQQQTSAPPNSASEDSEARKRKTETGEEMIMKRQRTNSGSPEHSRASEHNPPNQMAAPSPSASARVKARRKIEYVPIVREIETAGGRDVNQIQAELLRMSRGQPLRDINDWGRVSIDTLTMSLRSRLSVELSYALTTLCVLSTMRSQGADTGILIYQCPELVEELVYLLEDMAFPDGFSSIASTMEDEITTNRQLIQFAHEEISSPLAPDSRRQGEHDPSAAGPTQRRADLIKFVLNLFRNLSAITVNQQHLAQNGPLIDILLAITSLDRSESTTPARPLSDAFSLADLIAVRKDVVNILVNLSGSIELWHTEDTMRPKRVVALVASYLVDPLEAISPYNYVYQTGNAGIRAPILTDAALEVFTRISHLDANRRVIGAAVPQEWLWQLIESLVHRLPSMELDFKLLSRDDSWISYVEKLVLSLYSLAYLIPQDLKQRVKNDKSLSFAKVMLRFMRRLMKYGQSASSMRRAIETLKLIDDGVDSFASVQASAAPLSFGVGYGEHGAKREEIGHGLLGGQQDEVLWSVMFQRDLDEVMFAELESLARVEISAC